MNDLHDRFAAWLIDGARGDPPRDLALHASGCERCLSAAGAFDALQAVDIGALPPPAHSVRTSSVRRRAALIGAMRAAASAAAALLVGTALVIGASSWFGRDSTGTAIATRTPGEEVLAGGPSIEPTASGTLEPTPSPRASPSTSPSPSALETPASVIQPTLAPRTLAPAPTTVPVSAAPATPRPTTAPTATPTPAPTPTPIPSASATPSPDPSASAPAPSPSPSP